jgi:hypothetical protein
MTRRRNSQDIGSELRSILATLVFALVAYWFLTSGLYVQIVTGVAHWYAEQVYPTHTHTPS